MSSVDGLVTGMNTTEMISQLMQLEAAPQTVLKTKISTANKVVSSYQSVNSRLSSLATAAKALGGIDAWGAMKATSSSSAAVVSAAAGAAAGSLSFQVKQLAATQVMTFHPSPPVSDATGTSVLSGGTLTIALSGGGTADLNPTDTSLQGVASAINGRADALYKASVVQIKPGEYTLQLTAKESGQAAADKMTAAGQPVGLTLGSAAVTVQGRDAQLTVGDPTLNPYEISSATNTFAGVMPGVTITAVQAQSGTDSVTVDVNADADGIAAKVKALVDSANVVLNEISSQSRNKSGQVGAGPLVGNSAMRKLTQDILGAVSGGAAGLGTSGRTASFSEVGITVGRDGQLDFDQTKFLDLYKADPARAQKFFDSHTDKAGGTAGKFDPGFDTAVGLGRKLEALSLVASEGVVDPLNPTKAKQGTLQGLIQRNNDTIRSLDDQVAGWDVRLELRRTALEKRFGGLEVALGKMKQQSSWLAGQLAGLA
jgi:flagellar hook-associated protein 2